MEKEECIDWIRAYRAAGFPWRRRVCPRLFLGCPDFVGAGGFRGGGVGFQLPVVRPQALRLRQAHPPYRGDTLFSNARESEKRVSPRYERSAAQRRNPFGRTT